jgi:hypothetical protein
LKHEKEKERERGRQIKIINTSIFRVENQPRCYQDDGFMFIVPCSNLSMTSPGTWRNGG